MESSTVDEVKMFNPSYLKTFNSHQRFKNILGSIFGVLGYFVTIQFFFWELRTSINNDIAENNIRFREYSSMNEEPTRKFLNRLVCFEFTRII